MTAARMATANALTQGVAVATGLQKSFDWRGVAAAGVGAGVGAAVGNNLPSTMDPFLGRVVTSFTAGTAAAVARGGKVAIQQVAVDAFGNALGGALVDYANSPMPGAAASMGRPASIGANGEQRFGAMDFEPDPISQAYDYSQRNPNSGIRFSDAMEYFGAKESAQYLHSLIPDSQLVGRGKTTQGLDYYDWDSGSRATQTLLKSVQGVPLPAWEDTQVSALPSRESTRSYYQDIEDNASNPATAVLARQARVGAEGFHDNIDSFKSLVHLAQDDKARRMALAQGLYAIANPGETAKSAASGTANYFRTLSIEKAGEDGLRFLSGAALSAGVSKGASLAGSFASDALVLDRVAEKVGDAAGKVPNRVPVAGEMDFVEPLFDSRGAAGAQGLRESLARQAGIPRGLDNVWGASIDDLKATYTMDGYSVTHKPPHASSSGKAKVFNVDGNPLVREVQYSPPTEGLPIAERTQHIGEYYKFTYQDGSKAKLINPETYKMGSPENRTNYFNQQGQRIIYNPATRTWGPK